MIEEYCPKDILCGVYSPNKKLMEFMIKLKNVPGALAKVSDILANYGINILSGFHVAYPNNKEAYWSFFIDFTSAKAKLETIIEEIKKLEVVLSIKFAKAKFNGLIIDELHFPLTVLGERSITLRIESIAKIFKRIHEIFGSGAATILYEMGIKAGEAKVKSIHEKYGIKGLKALKIILAERIAKGWGIPELIEFDEQKPSIKIKVYDLFECLYFKGKLKESNSYFFKGYLVGALSTLLNKKLLIEEIECLAKGNDHCLFVSKS